MVLPKNDVLTFLLNNIHFLANLYIQVVGIPMGSKCAPLFVDLLLFCYERNFMMALSEDKQTVVLLLLTFCLLLLPLWESIIVLCFVVRYFMSILVLQSS